MAFSSAGLTPFGHDLKPDVAAPGGAILSSTLKRDDRRAVRRLRRDEHGRAARLRGGGAAPAAAPQSGARTQVKSALMSTAGPAWGDTHRTTEASVLLEGAGLIDVGRADEPLLFTDPQSLSFHYLNVNQGRRIRGRWLVTVADVGGGFGTWSGRAQSRRRRRPARRSTCRRTVTSRPAAYAAAHRGRAGRRRRRRRRRLRLHRPAARDDTTRRIPYAFTVERPGLESVPPKKLELVPGRRHAHGRRARSSSTAGRPPRSARRRATPARRSTRTAPRSSTSPTSASRRSTSASPSSSRAAGSLIDPFFLGSRDENDVTGYPGTPVNVNSYLYDYRADVQAAGHPVPAPGPVLRRGRLRARATSPAARSPAGTSCTPGSTTSTAAAARS